MRYAISLAVVTEVEHWAFYIREVAAWPTRGAKRAGVSSQHAWCLGVIHGTSIEACHLYEYYRRKYFAIIYYFRYLEDRVTWVIYIAARYFAPGRPILAFSRKKNKKLMYRVITMPLRTPQNAAKIFWLHTYYWLVIDTGRSDYGTPGWDMGRIEFIRSPATMATPRLALEHIAGHHWSKE